MNLPAPQHSELPPFGMPLTDAGVESRMHAQGAGARRQHNWFMIIVSVLLVGPFLLAIGIVCLLVLVAAIGGATQEQVSANPSPNVAPVSAVADREEIPSNDAVKLRSDSQLREAYSLPFEPTSLEFNGHRFELAFVRKSEFYGPLNEYVLEGESLKNWTKMISVAQQPIDVAPADFTAALLNQLKKVNPNLAHITWTIRGEPYGEQKGIGFTLRKGEITELSLMLYQRSPEGNGLLVHQYAERVYGDESEAFLLGIEGRINGIVQQVSQFDFPELIQETEAL
jgi:hypothetical protein